MSYTKRQFINASLEEIGIASYDFDISPEQYESALRRLDSMMATWNAKGIRVGYSIPTSPENSDLDQETTVPDSANEAIITNLAIKLAPGYGKMVSNDTKATAKDALNTLAAIHAMPLELQLPGSMPSGAGNKFIDIPYLTPPTNPLLAGNDSAIDFN